MRTSKTAGFTLIEILVIVGIIGILASLSIPMLLRARMSANQAGASGAMRTITAAQVDFYNNSLNRPNQSYAASLADLGSGNSAGEVAYIDGPLADGAKSGYTFRMVPGSEKDGSYFTWSLAAWPISYRNSGILSYYVDETGIIRRLDIGGAVGTVDMPQSN